MVGNGYMTLGVGAPALIAATWTQATFQLVLQFNQAVSWGGGSGSIDLHDVDVFYTGGSPSAGDGTATLTFTLPDDTGAGQGEDDGYLFIEPGVFSSVATPGLVNPGYPNFLWLSH